MHPDSQTEKFPLPIQLGKDVSEKSATDPELAAIVNEVQKILTEDHLVELTETVDRFQNPGNPYGLCGFSASIVTKLLSSLQQGRRVRLGFGVFIAPNSMPIYHFYTLIDDRVYVDLTYDQFDHNDKRLIIDTKESLGCDYRILNFD